MNAAGESSISSIVVNFTNIGDKYEVSTFALHKDYKILKKVKNFHPKK